MPHLASPPSGCPVAHDSEPADPAAPRREPNTGDAQDFLDLPELVWVGDSRRCEVARGLASGEPYEPTRDELLWLAKLAWRNHARCAGRLSWDKLTLADARDCETAEDVAEACWEHLRWSTNDGAVRPLLTVFAPARGATPEPRPANPQLIRYAGYRQEDGTVLGDPLHVPLTEFVRARGWSGEGTAFDVLPLVVCRDDGSGLRIFDVPDDCVLEVDIVHPEHDWFAELGLRWHANPAVSNFSLVGAGLEFPCTPFTGWYHSSEIGARNLSDRARYDMLPEIGRRLGLDQRSERTLWRDRALVELNRAVLHSYRQANVQIVDHHTASKQFARHVAREEAAGREVRADWAWINPPLSASLTATFDLTFAEPDPGMRPDFVPARSYLDLDAS